MRKGLIVSLFFLMGFFSAFGAENILRESDFSKFKAADSPEKGWVVKDLSVEVSASGIRLREVGEGSEGAMTCKIKHTPSAKFIQVKAGIAEQAENTFYLSSGGEKYKIFTGLNTFPINSKDINQGLLTITIIQDGIPGKNPSGWADLELLRVVEKPLDGLVITLENNGNTAKIGDSVLFKYYPAGSIIEKSLDADCFVFPEISDYRFNEKPVILKKESDGTFSCTVKVDENAYAFKSGNGKNVFANVYVAGMRSYAFTSFNIDVKEIIGADKKVKNALPPPVFKGANPDIVKYRKMWKQYTEGNNLAIGKTFLFSKKTDYHLTRKGDSDTADLTDGKLSSRKCDTIWFDSAAVGWYMSGAENGVNCLLDLGEVKPVRDVVIRALTGKAQTNLAAPQELKVFVSRDGKDFYEAAGMIKLMEAEKDLSDFKKHFFVEEIGKAYVYPYKLQINADARYIGVYIKGATGAVFADEIAVMEGVNTASGFNEVYKGQKEKFVTNGILVEPRLKELVISTNINTPNAFQLTDMRDSPSKKEVKLVVEVPEGINIISPEASPKAVEINGGKYTRWEMPLKRQGKQPQTKMIFFGAEKSVNVKLPAFIYTEYDGLLPEKLQVPVKLVEIPEVKPRLKRLMVCLQWMGEDTQKSYPDFFKAYKTMGFNAVPCFPRYWIKNKDESIKYIESARKEGFAISMNESPFHVMEKGHKEDSEIFSQLKNGKLSKNLCPSYFGDYYVKEMNRVAECVKNSKPDYVFWDIECWYGGTREASVCTRCLEGQKASGKSMEEYLKDCGTRKMKDLKDAVKRGISDGKMPIIHCYDTHPTAPNYNGILDFNRFYPAYVDVSANSFYVAGNTLKVHDEMRENYNIIKANKCLPWLSAGTYGEYPPYKLEQMILEALMNGACGILYYCYTDFDTPMDFYYHSKALAEIAPYEDLLLDGEKRFDLIGSNKNFTYSATKKGNEMLLLIGNYKRDPNGETEINLPFRSISEIRDLRNNKKIMNSGNIFKANIPKDEIGFYYIKGI
ncbi:MAG: hypothetical protein A2017_10720 [Lentisphaerae bacterium GWF2_44_16]|nr:MAG: hypothetical protein A2017_10720 [Lentisphaerae bacterium GWF2_44_16]